MKPATRILRALATFPATRRVCEALAETHGATDGAAVIDELLAAGKVRFIGHARGARIALADYIPPKKPRAKKRAYTRRITHPRSPT